MRQFRLKNALGLEYDLNDTRHLFYSPNGLGQKHDVEYENIGYRYEKIEDVLEQKQIKGRMRFSDYEEYHQFALFIQHKPLVLEYTSFGTYYMDVSIDQLDKEELGKLGLTPTIRINGLSSWYKVLKVENTPGMSGKVYPYNYPYVYSDFSAGEIRLQSDSTIESPCRIHLMGPCTNPSWSHYLNGSRMMTGKLGTADNPCIVEAGKRIIIDNTGAVYSIKEYDTDGKVIRNLYALSDFSTRRFVTLGYGENRILYQHEGTNEMKAIVEGRIIYAGI